MCSSGGGCDVLTHSREWPAIGAGDGVANGGGHSAAASCVWPIRRPVSGGAERNSCPTRSGCASGCNDSDGPVVAGRSGHGVTVKKITVQQHFVGLLIGPRGEALKQITAESGATSIRVDQTTSQRGFSTVHVQGGMGAIRKAMELMEKKMLRASPHHLQRPHNGAGTGYLQHSNGAHDSLESMSVDQRWVGGVVGPGGEMLRSIEKESGARLAFNQGTWEEGYSTLRIIGPFDAIALAKKLVNAKIAQMQVCEGQPGAAIEIRVPQEFVGLIIGRGGTELKRIQDESKAVVKVDQSTKNQGYSTFSVLPGHGASSARELIIAKLQEGSANSGCFEETEIDQSNEGTLIGRSWETTKNINAETSARVSVDQRIRGIQNSIIGAMRPEKQKLGQARDARGNALAATSAEKLTLAPLQVCEQEASYRLSCADFGDESNKLVDREVKVPLDPLDDPWCRRYGEGRVVLDAWDDDEQDNQSSVSVSGAPSCWNGCRSGSACITIEDVPNHSTEKVVPDPLIHSWSKAGEQVLSPSEVSQDNHCLHSQRSQGSGLDGELVASQGNGTATVDEAAADNTSMDGVVGVNEAGRRHPHTDGAQSKEEALRGMQDLDRNGGRSTRAHHTLDAKELHASLPDSGHSLRRLANVCDEEVIVFSRASDVTLSALGSGSSEHKDTAKAVEPYVGIDDASIDEPRSRGRSPGSALHEPVEIVTSIVLHANLGCTSREDDDVHRIVGGKTETDTLDSCIVYEEGSRGETADTDLYGGDVAMSAIPDIGDAAHCDNAGSSSVCPAVGNIAPAKVCYGRQVSDAFDGSRTSTVQSVGRQQVASSCGKPHLHWDWAAQRQLPVDRRPSSSAATSQQWSWDSHAQWASSEPRGAGRACCYYLQGWCKHGARCEWLHVEDQDPDYTVCAFGERCNHRHGWAVREGGRLSQGKECRPCAPGKAKATAWSDHRSASPQLRVRHRSASPQWREDGEIWPCALSMDGPRRLRPESQNEHHYVKRGRGRTSAVWGDSLSGVGSPRPESQCASQKRLRAIIHALLGSWHGELSKGGGVQDYEVTMGSATGRTGCGQLTCETWHGDALIGKKLPIRCEGGDIILGERRRFYLDAVTDRMATWMSESAPEEMQTWRRPSASSGSGPGGRWQTSTEAGPGFVASSHAVSPSRHTAFELQ